MALSADGVFTAVGDLTTAATNQTSAVQASVANITEVLSELNQSPDNAVKDAARKIQAQIDVINGSNNRLDQATKRVLSPGPNAVPALSAVPDAPPAQESKADESHDACEHYSDHDHQAH